MGIWDLSLRVIRPCGDLFGISVEWSPVAPLRLEENYGVVAFDGTDEKPLRVVGGRTVDDLKSWSVCKLGLQ